MPPPTITPATTVKELAAQKGLDTQEIIMLLMEFLPIGTALLAEIQSLPKPLTGAALGGLVGRAAPAIGAFVDKAILEAND